MSSWFFIRLKDSIISIFRPKDKEPPAQQLRDDKAYNAYRSIVRKELDRILDKISKYGVKSLTKKEREYLDKNKDT